MLRAEAAAGEIRQDNVEDEDDFDDGGIGSSYGSMYIQVSENSGNDSDDSDESEGFVDEEYDMADDNTLFYRNIDAKVDEDMTFSHTDMFSNQVHEQLRDEDGNPDLAYDSDEVWSDKESSDVEGDPSKLYSYPKFNPKTDCRQSKFVIGMLFSSREELKAVTDTYNIKDARATKYVKNEKGKVRVVYKDESCK